MRVTPKAVSRPSAQQASERQNDGDRAGHRQIGDVHVVGLQREEGEHDRGGVGDRADARDRSRR